MRGVAPEALEWALKRLKTWAQADEPGTRTKQVIYRLLLLRQLGVSKNDAQQLATSDFYIAVHHDGFMVYTLECYAEHQEEMSRTDDPRGYREVRPLPGRSLADLPPVTGACLTCGWVRDMPWDGTPCKCGETRAPYGVSDEPRRTPAPPQSGQ